MALPDFNAYYLAAQLSQIFHIDRDRFLHSLCPKRIWPTLDPLVVITGRGGDKGKKNDRRSFLYQYRRVWEIASDRLHIMSPHSCTHLWHNTSLPEFNLIQDNRVWSLRGIVYLSQITHNGKLKSFDSLKTEIKLPNRMFYRYIQLLHAFHAQFPLDDLVLNGNPLLP